MFLRGLEVVVVVLASIIVSEWGFTLALVVDFCFDSGSVGDDATVCFFGERFWDCLDGCVVVIVAGLVVLVVVAAVAGVVVVGDNNNK